MKKLNAPLPRLATLCCKGGEVSTTRSPVLLSPAEDLKRVPSTSSQRRKQEKTGPGSFAPVRGEGGRFGDGRGEGARAPSHRLTARRSAVLILLALLASHSLFAQHKPIRLHPE